MTSKDDLISIQALYDYKFTNLNYFPAVNEISIQALYDYKIVLIVDSLICSKISIQALYDYKPAKLGAAFGNDYAFQFKHCTIIRLPDVRPIMFLLDFNSSIVRL